MAVLKSGCVTLVGAGPGSPELITVGGRKALENGEVILFDKLVGEEILALMPEEAVKIDVGKSSGRHTVPQEEINALIFKYAKEGKNVVRLKGGDPYLFGRGAEELELLQGEGIPFRVIPGITSALSVPAFGGIPITHRNYASSVHILTGHGKKGEPPVINYKELVKLKGTLVFLMGVSSMEYICSGLINAGMDKSVPAALVENGTKPEQRKLISTIGEIAEKAKEKHFVPPSILIVGQVVTLSDYFDFTQKLPLFGKNILTASSKITGSRLAEGLRALGSNVNEYQSIHMEPLNQENVWSEIESYQWIVFTSAYGANLFFDEMLKRKIDIRKLYGARFAAVGRETAKAVSKRGITVDYMPETYDGRHLGEGLIQIADKSDKILLYRAKDGAGELPRILSEKNYNYDDIDAYRTISDNALPEIISARLRGGKYDMITFTSASSVHGLMKRLEYTDVKGIKALCIGEKTAEAAKEYDLDILISPEASLESMVQTASEYFGG